jgi:site-specific DNA recombinase
MPYKAIPQEEFYQAFLKVYNKLLDNKDMVLKMMLDQLLELQVKTTLTKPDIVEINEKNI